MKTFLCQCVCLCVTLLSIGFSASVFAEDVTATVKTVTIASGGTNTTTYDGTVTTQPYGTLFFDCTVDDGNRTQTGVLTGNMNLKVQFGDAFVNSNRFMLSNANNTFIGSIEINTGTVRINDISSLGTNKNITFADGSLMTASTGFDSSYTFTITGDKLCGLRAAGAETNFGAKIIGAGSLEIVNDGVVVLSNTENDYQGTTYIGKNAWRSDGLKNAATLKLGASGVLPDTTVINMGGGSVSGNITFDLNGVAETVTGLNGSSKAYITNSKNGVAASLTLNTASEQSYDYKGSITGNSETALTTLNVIGAGTQNLSSATITNTNLSVGDTATLILKNDQALPNLNVGANATLSAANNSNPMTLTLTGADASSIEGTLSASATSIIYNGTGTLTLSKTNLYSGTTTVSDGTLVLEANNAIENSTWVKNNAAITFGSTTQTLKTLTGTGTISGTTGGALTLNYTDNSSYSGKISGGTSVNKTGGGTLTLSGANTFTGGMTISEGIVSVTAGTTSLGNGALTLNSGATLIITGSDSNNTITISGAATLNGIFDLSSYLTTWDKSTTYTLMTAGSISGTPFLHGAPNGWVYSVDGTNIVLNYLENSNWIWTGSSSVSFNEPSNWDKGTVPVTGSDVIIYSDTTNTANVDSNALVKTVALDAASNLQFEAGKTLTAQSMTIGGENPTLDLTDGNLTLITAPAFNITNSDSDSANTSTLTLSSERYANVISGNVNLTKIGAGTLTLSNTNTYTGATTISGGTLALDANNAIALSTWVTNNAAITFGATSQTLQGLSGAGTITGTGALTLVNPTVEYTGTISDASSVTINITDSSAVWNGIITGTTSVIKSGNGTLILSNTNTRSGTTTISAGRIKATNVSALGNGAVINNSELEFNLETDDSGTYSKVFSGTGALIKSGNGKLTLSGTNTYSGITTISGGTLSVSKPANLGSGTIAIEENGTLEVTGTQTWSKTFTGTGKIDVTPSAFSQYYLFNGSNITGFSGTVDIDKTRFRAVTDKRTTNYITYNVGNPVDPTNDVQLWINATTVNGTFNLASLGYTTSPSAGGGEGAIRLENGATVGGTINVLNDSCIGTFDGAYNASNTVSANINLDDKKLYIGNYNYTSSLDQFRSVTLSGAISGTGNLFLRPGTGKTVTISSANNSFTGTTIVGDTALGPGTLILTGENAIANSTSVIVNTGITFGATTQTLQNLSGAGTITGSGALTLVNTSDSTYSGIITGVASVTKTGAGTLTLSAANTYEGNTTLSAGRIIATNVSALGSGTVTNNAALEFNLASAGEYGKVISGSGALYKTGAGTLTLSAANTYEGSTTISAGRIIATKTSAFGTGAVENNSELEFNLATDDTGEYGKVISGSGALIKTGAGVLTLSAANTYKGNTTISAGTLELDVTNAIIESTSVTNNGTITAESNQTFKNLSGTESTALINLTNKDLELLNTGSTPSKFVGRINVGTGTIRKTGPGTLQLLGATQGDIKASSFVVNSGRLDVKGYLTGSLVVEKDGEFSPGNSVGTTEVSGDFTLTGNLIMEVESATSYDILNIAGAGTYNEGSRIVLNLYVPTGAETLELNMINYIGIGGVTGTENWVLGENARYWQDATFSNGKLNIKVNLNAIPEPSTWALLILGALGLMYFRRKK